MRCKQSDEFKALVERELHSGATEEDLASLHENPGTLTAWLQALGEFKHGAQERLTTYRLELERKQRFFLQEARGKGNANAWYAEKADLDHRILMTRRFIHKVDAKLSYVRQTKRAISGEEEPEVESYRFATGYAKGWSDATHHFARLLREGVSAEEGEAICAQYAERELKVWSAGETRARPPLPLRTSIDPDDAVIYD